MRRHEICHGKLHALFRQVAPDASEAALAVFNCGEASGGREETEDSTKLHHYRLPSSLCCCMFSVRSAEPILRVFSMLQCCAKRGRKLTKVVALSKSNMRLLD